LQQQERQYETNTNRWDIVNCKGHMLTHNAPANANTPRTARTKPPITSLATTVQNFHKRTATTHSRSDHHTEAEEYKKVHPPKQHHSPAEVAAGLAKTAPGLLEHENRAQAKTREENELLRTVGNPPSGMD
jgi:hypothetical protein